MNIIELNERNYPEALRAYKKARVCYCETLGIDMPDDETIRKSFYGTTGEGITYLFTEKGTANGLVTIDKASQEIKNLSLDFAALSKPDLNKILEFTLKQFSAIALVFVWVSSLSGDVISLIEEYGFEYTGEQGYVDKDKFISDYKYVYRRKR